MRANAGTFDAIAGWVPVPRLFDLVMTPAMATWGATLRALESWRPLRAERGERARRYVVNGALALGAGLAERALVLPALVATARVVERRQRGIVRSCRDGLLRGVLGFAALDLGMYAWHRLSHESDFFWRFHRVHHADLGLDLTTAVRLHPVELLLSLPIRCAQVALLGTSVRTVVAYEAAMQAAALFHHADIDLTSRGDALAARVFMTPRLHTRHHAATARERACNWGIISSVWDRLLGTFVAQPADDPRLGIETERGADTQRVRALAKMPWSSRGREGTDA